MGAERGELAAARVRAAARRAEQLRERIARLQAGIVPTREDVERARAAADAQRNETTRAQQRLLLTYAAAADLSRRWPSTSRQDEGPRQVSPDGEPSLRRVPWLVAPEETPAAGAATSGSTSQASPPHDDASAVQRLSGENRLLRASLVSMASVGGDGDPAWPTERRRLLWQALVDQCGQEAWHGWAHALCATVTSSLSGIRGVAISGYDDHHVPHLLAVSDEWTRQVEEIHQTVGEGPAVAAYTAQTPVVVTSLEDEQVRWPGYVAAAAGHGLSGLCALPIRLNGVSLGSLTLYRNDESESVRDSWLDVTYLAAVAAKALLVDLDAVEDGFYPWHAGDHQIQVAAGILSVQLEASVDEALALMRAFAFSNALGLSQVADAIVDGSVRLV